MDSIQLAVVRTLRITSRWCRTAADRRDLSQIADDIETDDNWLTCPLCGDEVCDPDCPMQPLRAD
jgi:hypothetical protein